MAYKSVNPYTGETLQTFDNATDEDIDRVLANAESAFQQWRKTSISERTELLVAIAKLLVERSKELGDIVAAEMGKVTSPHAMSVTGQSEAQFVSTFFAYYAKNAEEMLKPRKLSDFRGNHVVLAPEPLGTIFAVEPWNYPIYQVGRVLAPQFAAGNPVILKHASNVPQTALALEQLVRDAGAPEGLFQNVFATHDQVSTIIKDPRVRGVALTGSGPAGVKIAEQAGAALKKCTLELGGSDPFIVLDDADLDLAAKLGVTNRFENSGQMCISSKRFFVMDSVYDEFIEKFKQVALAYTPGDPMDPETTFAPLSSQDQADTVKKQVADAVAAGAQLEEIGKPVPQKGTFVQPGILTGVTRENPAYYDEIFGPVAMFFRVKDEDEAITLANDSPFGLSGAVMSRDLKRAKRVAEQIDSGMVVINGVGAPGPEIPFGGVKESGFGRELGDLGIHEFVNYKWITDIDA